MTSNLNDALFCKDSEKADKLSKIMCGMVEDIVRNASSQDVSPIESHNLITTKIYGINVNNHPETMKTMKQIATACIEYIYRWS